jgi:flagellar motor protein MotB
MKHPYIYVACAALLTLPAMADPVQETQIGEAVERHLSSDDVTSQWTHDAQLLKREGGDTVETRQVSTERVETVKLQNVIPPIRFESGVANIPPSYVDSLRKVLEEMRDRRNVRLHLVGHADNQRLSEALARRYRDNEGLSRERAGEVAEFLKTRLDLADDAISYEWAGDTRPIANNATAEGRALNRRVEVEVWYDEMKEHLVDHEVLVKEDFKRVKVCRMETLCKMRFREGHARRARLKNLVQPLHFDDNTTEVSPSFIEHVREALANLSDKQNVVVKFIGYTDNQPLSGRNERIYGTPLALSKARAQRVALAVQDALKLPTEAVLSDGRGDAQPVARNDSEQGRALNRRVEVEFWHDDPLQEMPDEPQLCPADNAGEMVTREYTPPWGSIASLKLEGGRAIIPAGYTDLLRRAMNDIRDRQNVRLRFVGYTKNERLERRTAVAYGDDIGLSAARARRAMEAMKEQMGLSSAQVEHEGRGYVQSKDVVNEGFTQGESSYVAVQVVYDELAVVDDYEGVDVTRMTRELSPKNPFALNVMRITVDGEPVDDPNRSSEDVQRCTDVALDRASMQFQFDSLQSRRRLAVVASPTTIAVHEPTGQPMMDEYAEYDPEDEAVLQERLAESLEEQIAASLGQSTQEEQATDAEEEQLADSLEEQPADAQGEQPEDSHEESGAHVRFRMYTNYRSFIDRAEVRVFESEQSLQATPVTVIALDAAGNAEWQPAPQHLTSQTNELMYVVRAYDKSGEFDETAPQPLWLTRAEKAEEPETEPGKSAPEDDKELLAAYGESALAVRNIQLGSGTVKVRGSSIPPQHSVWVAGRPVPVDENGNFVAEEILPSGLHTVEVAVLDESGNGELFLRDLQFERNDWFYVGLADVTVSETRTKGPAELLRGENAAYDYDSTVDGRLAFYVNGKFSDHWRLAASADTREAPIDELFSNFLSKSPDSLFRRIDPDYHYPTFGDDSIVEEVAPTLGKFYVKLSHDESHALWGNFKISYFDNELTHVDRGLYGGNLHYQSEDSTSFGEQRLALDGFAAEPGTLASREEFRGTGGSLYFLRHQDILTGSERLRIELRDKDSGLVTGVKELRPVLDYDIDYLQGRILLTQPLASTASDNLLIRSDGLSGDEAHLVVRYEYTPGFEELDALATGGQGHYWINDYVKVGLTASTSEEGDADSSLNGADLTVRMSADSWLKLQGGKSEGLVSSSHYSNDGGFGFASDDVTSFEAASADAYRADLSIGFADLFDDLPGRLTLYTQTLDEGYSAPGLTALTNTEHQGGTLRLQVMDKVQLQAKADWRTQEQGIESNAQELDVGYQFMEHWTLSTGLRKDEREYDTALAPLDRERGQRTDGVMQVAYDSGDLWRTYVFAQQTLSRDDEREDNGRIGTGGSYRVTDRLRVDAEVSDGDLGPGGRLGTNYLFSERTTLYLNYSLENERTDNGLRGPQGNLISGMKRRLSDSSSMYVEERYQDSDSLTGLTHSTGMNLAPNDRWNFGASTDIGTLRDERTGAKTDREAGGVRMGYGFDSMQLSSAVEYRVDETQQVDQSISKRTTWLFRNNFKYQLTPDWRIVGKFNHALSDSTLGQFYDGGYTEAVLGYGYRPVHHDRLNALAKYTYFYNVPTTEQVTPQNTAAEFIQKSHIAALDVTFDLTSHWSIGGKYAYRLGQMSLDREERQFFDNRAHLYIVRTDLEVAQHWEALLEGRMLDMTDLNEQRSGALFAVYRYLGEHVKVGMGYNFTDFSEDLTDLSFTHQGAFINVIGSM